MAYEIVFTPAAERDLRKLPGQVLGTVRRKIDGLADDPRPRGVEKMAGAENLYRIRTGDYRILYTIADRKLIVAIVKIGNRRDVYRH